jgi:hypothetical protein
VKYLPKSWIGFATLIPGVVLIFIGLELLEDVGILRDRTEQRVAVVQGVDIRFTTLAGIEYVVPLNNTCRRAEPTPKRGCLERYVDGDEVLVWYDNADPTHTWEGSTPGGGVATSVMYTGIVLVTFALVTLYAIFVLPYIKQGSARLQEIVRRAPRP